MKKDVKLCKENQLKKGYTTLLKISTERGHELLTSFENYKGGDFPILLNNTNCGHPPYSIIGRAYVQNKGVCPICKVEKQRQETLRKYGDAFIKEVESNGHKLLSPYIDNDKPVIIDFGCEHGENIISARAYKRSQKCAKCVREISDKQKSMKSMEKLLKKIKHNWLNKDEFKTLRSSQLLIQCECGSEPRLTSYNNIKKRVHSGCKACSQDVWVERTSSKAENLVSEYLKKKGILFAREYTDKGLPNRRYDFYLPDYNLIIEIHGQQHYREAIGFGRPLREQQKIDRLKKTHALSKGFSYIEVDYKESKPDLALKRFVGQFELFKIKQKSSI